ncbi:MAG TPA: hypothetical protein VM598_13485, partial [Bdellovibrionota bacterium]|nr:hypothetical protein [Bdellovibrionota bacterium]
MSELDFKKKEEELLPHLVDATFLIADPTPTRRVLQRLLSACKVKPSNIKTVDTDAEAIEQIGLLRPNVVFADHELPLKGGIELAQHHDRAVSSRHLKVFFLISDSDSAALANTIADENIDALLVRPLSLTGLKESVFAVLGRKIHPSDYMATLQEGL